MPESFEVPAAGPDVYRNFVLPTALDDPPGRYRLRFADVLSGASAELGLEAR